MHKTQRLGVEQLEPRLVLSNTTFVQGLYREVLHRDGSQGEIAGHAQALDRGASRDDVARTFLQSGERLSIDVNRLYQEILGRSADAGGLAGNVASLSRGAALRDVALGLLTSAEYQNAHPDDRAFITGLFQDLLHRLPAEAEIQAQSAGLRGGRAAVALGVLNSGERANDAVGDFYVEFLHRSGTAPERDAQARGALANARIEDAARVFVLSAEFEAHVEFEIEHGVPVRQEQQTEVELEVEHGPEAGHHTSGDDGGSHT